MKETVLALKGFLQRTVLALKGFLQLEPEQKQRGLLEQEHATENVCDEYMGPAEATGLI